MGRAELGVPRGLVLTSDALRHGLRLRPGRRLHGARRGHGNLLGRTMADIVPPLQGEAINPLPWSSHASPSLGARDSCACLASRAIVSTLGSADAREDRRDRPVLGNADRIAVHAGAFISS